MPAGGTEVMNMKKTRTKCGYIAYAATADDTKKTGGMGICDYCGKEAGKGYLIPILSSYYCPECYSKWDESAVYYEEDIPVQDRTAAYYESCIHEFDV